MNGVVFPVFFADQGERQVFRLLLSRGLGLAAAPALAATGRLTPVVVSDDEEVLTIAERLGLPAFRATAAGDESPLLPRGTQPAARRLMRERTLLQGWQTAAVVDFRAVDVDAAQLEALLAHVGQEEGDDPEAVLVGMRLAEDHPVQFNIFMDTLAVEPHLYADPEAGAALALRASCPFAVQLDQTEPPAAGQRLMLPAAGLGGALEPVADADSLAHLAEGAPMYLHVGQGMARRLLEAGASWPAAAMIPFGGRLDESRLLLLPAEDGTINVYAHGLPAASCRLSCFPLQHGHIVQSPRQEYWIRPDARFQDSLLAAGQVFKGPVCCLAPMDGEGLLLVCEQEVQEGPCDRAVPVRMEHGAWDILPDGSRMCTQTGRAILGRQDFPPVWEVDGSVAALPAARMALLLSEDFVNHIQGWPLPDPSPEAMAMRLGLGMAVLGLKGTLQE